MVLDFLRHFEVLNRLGFFFFKKKISHWFSAGSAPDSWKSLLLRAMLSVGFLLLEFHLCFWYGEGFFSLGCTCLPRHDVNLVKQGCKDMSSKLVLWRLALHAFFMCKRLEVAEVLVVWKFERVFLHTPMSVYLKKVWRVPVSVSTEERLMAHSFHLKPLENLNCVYGVQGLQKTFFFLSLRSHPQHLEFPSPGIESEL